MIYIEIVGILYNEVIFLRYLKYKIAILPFKIYLVYFYQKVWNLRNKICDEGCESCVFCEPIANHFNIEPALMAERSKA